MGAVGSAPLLCSMPYDLHAVLMTALVMAHALCW